MTTQVRVLQSLADIATDQWNACVRAADPQNNPFVSHQFLLALEQSGSATAATGWAARHLVLEIDGKVEAVAPCYLKSHSQGEYVFDHGWAEAFQRAGGSYYPKLQIAVPFTPVTGPRFITANTQHQQMLAAAAIELCSHASASSVHVTFATPAEAKAFSGSQWQLRNDTQFHWRNNNYGSYTDFLATLSSAKRKNLRKERQAVASLGITFEHLSGTNLREVHWDHFFAFYTETGSRKWGRPYLTRKFFSLINEQMPENILLVMAKSNNRYIAGALNFIGGDTLYGRNWGAVEQHPFLHFETCYYQAQDFAIARKLRIVEAGAQGEHKLARGYVPVPTQSLHYLQHTGLRRAVADYLAAERQAVAADQALLAQHTPFRHTPDHQENDI